MAFGGFGGNFRNWPTPGGPNTAVDPPALTESKMNLFNHKVHGNTQTVDESSEFLVAEAWRARGRRLRHPGYAFEPGDLVRSMAGHCSETSGSGVSLPVMRSGAMA